MGWKCPFWENLVQKIKIVYWLKFGTWANSNTQNSMGMFTFLSFGLKYLFWAYWSKSSNLFVQGKIHYLDWSEYAELSRGVLCICFRLDTPFLGKFGPKNENCQFQLKFDTQPNSKMSKSIFTIFVFELYSFLWQICFKKPQLRVEAEMWNPG